MTRVNVEAEDGLELTQTEREAIIAEAQEKYPDSVVTAIVTLDETGENLHIHCKVNGPKFERIRRITGYLVGTIDRWNDAKQSEERDRVKHCEKPEESVA